MTHAEFEAAVAEGRTRSLVNSGVDNLIRHVRMFGGVPGDIVECGSWRGGSAMIIAAAARYHFPNDPKTVFAMDSFSGFPRIGEEDDGEQFVGRFGDVDYDEVVTATAHVPNLKLIRGDYRDTVPAFAFRPISLLFLDCDLYESYHLCLKHLWPMVVPGGVALLEDHNCMPGATQAVREFFGPDISKVINREGLAGIVRYADPGSSSSSHADGSESPRR